MRKVSKGANRVILRIFRDMKHLNFGWAPYRNLHGAGLRKNSGEQKVNFFGIKSMFGNDPRKASHIIHTTFSAKLD